MGLEEQREKRERRELIEAVKGVSVAVVKGANIIAYAIQEAATNKTRLGAARDENLDEGFVNEKPDAHG